MTRQPVAAGKLEPVTLQLFDSAAGELRPFVPLVEGKVGMYICGLTTQGSPHIGHVRFTVAFDILRRWLETGHGYEVTLVRNVTDIDDKILNKSAEHDVPWEQWSYAHERETNDALDLLGVRRPSYEPRATGHVTDMVELMQILIEKGHAYAAEDGSGDVYFDVRSWPEYGSLTRQKVDDMEAAADADPRGKRDPRDFALWKGHKAGEPESASWPTPYGEGRPGWHLECSAMARRWLGDEFDIHGGGIDLRFPHHENEQAQSRAAGLGFAQYWLHNGWVTLGGEKMSKSLGNTLAVGQITKKVRPLVLRYYLGAVNYRATIEYHDGALDEAATAVDRIEGFLERALPNGPDADVVAVPDAFAAAMDADLNVSGALAVVFEAIREGNSALDRGDTDRARALALQVVAMTAVLGVNPYDPQWSSSSEDRYQDALGQVVEVLLASREQARADRDFVAADAIRDQLTAAGIAVEDTPDGARWSLLTAAERAVPEAKD